MTRLVIASGNPGKLREFSALLVPFGFDAVAQSALGIDDADEPHPTFVENALAKARHASAASGLPALADDSGLCVAALGGMPGVRSARYADDAAGPAVDRAGRDARNNARLVAELSTFEERTARFVCVLALTRAPLDPEPLIAIGQWAGRIVDQPRGSGGFGYDPYFLLPELGLTAAELDVATKNRISHRALAFARLIEQLGEATWLAR